MNTIQYKSLCRKVWRRYRFPLNLSYVEACECCDDVYNGTFTKSELLSLMDESVRDEQRGDPNMLYGGYSP